MYPSDVLLDLQIGVERSNETPTEDSVMRMVYVQYISEHKHTFSVEAHLLDHSGFKVMPT